MPIILISTTLHYSVFKTSSFYFSVENKKYWFRLRTLSTRVIRHLIHIDTKCQLINWSFVPIICLSIFWNITVCKPITSIGIHIVINANLIPQSSRNKINFITSILFINYQKIKKMLSSLLILCHNVIVT